MPRFHMINNEKVWFTPEEEAIRNAEEKAWADGASARAAEAIQGKRRAAYQAEADPLFFEEQRGEVPAGTHAAKVSEIKARFPKPE